MDRKLSTFGAAAILAAAMTPPSIPNPYDMPDAFDYPLGVPRSPHKMPKQRVSDPTKKAARKRQKQARKQNRRK